MEENKKEKLENAIDEIEDELIEEFSNKEYKKAEKIFEDDDKLEKLLEKAFKKCQEVPLVGNTLSYIPVLISMIRDYKNKKYTEVPLRVIISAIVAIVYFVAPVDFIPDFIPVIGFSDDAAAVAALLKFSSMDLDEYIDWKNKESVIFEKPQNNNDEESKFFAKIFEYIFNRKKDK